MRILLVVPRYNWTDKADYDYQFPLGLAYISAVMKEAGYDVDCVNLNHLNGHVSSLIVSKLNSKKYDIVCTGGNALMYRVIGLILAATRNHLYSPKTIIGGHIITSEPSLIFSALNPDFAIIGEGEETILELLNALEYGKELRNVKGIMYRDRDKAIMTEKRAPPKNLDKIPFPDFDGLGLEEQLKHLRTNYFFHTNCFDVPRMYPFLASRSCPYQCTFCYHESTYRTRSLKNIMKELSENVRKYRINILLLYDECFAIDKKRLVDICNGIKKLRSELQWDLRWIAQVRVDAVNKETLRIMKEAGCEAISYGFESFSPIVLKSMQKNITPEQIDTAFRETLKANMAIQANFIFGDIAETKETAKVTLDYYKKNCKGQIGLGFIQPYPRSKIYQHCIKKGIIKDKLDFIKNKIGQAGSRGLWLNMTDKMTDKEILELKKEILNSTSKYCKFVTPISLEKEAKGTYKVRAKCPFCKKEITYGNCLLHSKISYGFYVTCRNCHMRFFIVSLLQKIGYRYYPYVRAIRDFYLNIKDFFKRKSL